MPNGGKERIFMKRINGVETYVTGIEIGMEFKKSNFYDMIDALGIEWISLPRAEKRLITNICDQAATDFACEVRSVAAAFAVISTDPHVYRNPFTKPFVYRRGKAAEWFTILLEMYINEPLYVWEKELRQEEVSDLLKKRFDRHPVLEVLENRIDSIIEAHYLGEEAVDMAVNSFCEIPRNEWRNKVELVKGEIVTLY